MRRFLLLALLPLSACIGPKPASYDKTYSADGKEAYVIACNGGLSNIGVCYAKAGEICNSADYNVLFENGEVTPFGAATGFFGGTGGGLTATQTAFHSRSLIVQCKPKA